MDHQLHQSAIPRTSDLPANIHHVQNRQIDRHDSKLLNTQRIAPGNIPLPTSVPTHDDRLPENERRNQNYQSNYPKISTNFDPLVHRNVAEKPDPPLGNTAKFPKKDQSNEPAPYTVIQTYADRLRYN